MQAVAPNQGEGELGQGLHPSGLKQEHLEWFVIDADIGKQEPFQDGFHKDFRYEVEVLDGSFECSWGIEGSRGILKYC